MREIAGLPFDVITMIIPPIFSIISILYWYILGREIFNDKFKVVILVLIAFLPMYGVMNSLFTPNHESFLMLPLVLYCLIKSQNAADKRDIRVILITLSTMYFLHPLVAVMVMSIYALQYVSDIIPNGSYHLNLMPKILDSNRNHGNDFLDLEHLHISFSQMFWTL